jgi:RNA polymerase II C-terminal domain phosphatase-like 1/2
MANTMVTIQTDVFFGSSFLSKVSLTSSMDVNWLNRLFSPSIHLTSYSTPSDRLPPQVVLHTICENGVLFKVAPASSDKSSWTELKSVHTACMEEKKSMFVHIEGKELHLVATDSGRSEPCFWAYVCRTGQYSVCCSMLNQRTLALVFDLDETLIIANTMKSFDDRIASAERRLRNEPDPEKQAQYADESASLQQDKDLLRDYMDRNKVTCCDVEFEAEFEEAPSAVTPGVILQRPLIRLPNGVILTRINPTNRDTSVLIKIRPFWEDLREYILTKGRKRYEPFVCTLSEKEYAWEVWRLLDPGARLIDWGALKDRVVCVRPDIKKSLLGVFSKVCCNPGMSIVIDDRLKVWEEEDQSRVHVVPQYAPYSNPGMESAIDPPVMHAARNAIYNARAAYYKYVDEDLLQAAVALTHETDPKTLPARPDVSTFLKAEPSFPLAPVSANGGLADGMSGAEERASLGTKMGEESGTRDGVVGGDSTAEVSSPAPPAGRPNDREGTPGAQGEWPAPLWVAEKGEEAAGPDKTGVVRAPDGSEGEESESGGQEEGAQQGNSGEQAAPVQTVSDTQRLQGAGEQVRS